MVNRPSNAIGSIEARHPSLPATADAPTTPLTVAPASLADAAAVVDVIAEAFLNDPTSSWAFPDPAARRRWWELCIDGALRYPWTIKTDGFETVSVWVPPSGTEFSHEAEQQLPGLLKALVGSRASEVAELLRRFDEAHPRNEPHYYLSLGHQGRASRAWPRHGASQGEPGADRRRAHAGLSRVQQSGQQPPVRVAWIRIGRFLPRTKQRPCRYGDVAEEPMNTRATDCREIAESS